VLNLDWLLNGLSVPWGLSVLSIGQLCSFIEYKARLSGVRVVAVDPRNTSRTCPVCGHCEKANRRSQAQFLCVSCGHAGLADSIAAQNIRRAAINRPIVDNAFGVELQTPLLATG